MKVYIQNGHVIRATAPAGGISSDAGMIAGNIFGVACYSSAAGDPIELAVTGVYQLPKETSAILTLGAKVSWDNTTKQVTTPGMGYFPIGVAVEDAGNGATSVNVRLDGVSTAAA